MSKEVWQKPRPKKLGKPKPFNTSSKKYKNIKVRANEKFGTGVSLVKNMWISKQMRG